MDSSITIAEEKTSMEQQNQSPVKASGNQEIESAYKFTWRKLILLAVPFPLFNLLSGVYKFYLVFLINPEPISFQKTLVEVFVSFLISLVIALLVIFLTSKILKKVGFGKKLIKWTVIALVISVAIHLVPGMRLFLAYANSILFVYAIGVFFTVFIVPIVILRKKILQGSKVVYLILIAVYSIFSFSIFMNSQSMESKKEELKQEAKTDQQKENNESLKLKYPNIVHMKPSYIPKEVQNLKAEGYEEYYSGLIYTRTYWCSKTTIFYSRTTLANIENKKQFEELRRFASNEPLQLSSGGRSRIADFDNTKAVLHLMPNPQVNESSLTLYWYSEDEKFEHSVSGALDCLVTGIKSKAQQYMDEAVLTRAISELTKVAKSY